MPLCSTGRRSSALKRLEPHPERDRVGEAAKIDLRHRRVPAGREALIRRQIRDAPLILQLAADAPGADRHANTAEEHRTRLPSAADEVAVDDRHVVVGDEVAVLAVAIVDDADPAADIRLHRAVPADGKVAKCGGDRYGAQLE